MKLRFVLFACIYSAHGFLSQISFADDTPALLEAVDKYSFCTPYYGVSGYSLGVVGNDWALTFEIPENRFSGAYRTTKAHFYRGPNMHYYISKPAGPRRPPLPETEAYSQIEFAGVNVDVQRIRIYDKVNGPIEIAVDDFTINNRQFHIPDRVKIICTGPNP